MKTYEKYKNSGVAWLGKIPEHWKIKTLKNIFLCVGGNGFKIELQKFSEGDYPFCKVSDLNGEGKEIIEAKFYVSKQIVKQEKFNVIPKYSLLFSKIGEALKKNHRKINLVPCCIDNNCAALINRNANFSIQYGYYLSKCIDMAYFDNGGTIPYVDVKSLMLYLIPVPPLAEQEAIVKFLDYKVSRIEKLISIRQAQIVNLKELKKAVINKAVTKGDWKRVRLKRLFKIFSGATPKSDNPQYWDGNIIWITPADFQTQDKYIYDGAKNITSEGFKSCSTSLIPAGSIIFSKRAPVGKVAINKIALCTNQGCLSCVPLENISSEFFYYVMSICQEEFEKEAAGTTFKEISLTAFANFLLPAPSISEQNEIAEYLDKKCAQIDKLITIREKQITELNELKVRLISDAVTGKIDVR